MGNYKFLRKKAFENQDKFEKRVNETAAQGWKVVNFVSDNSSIVVLFERVR